MTVQIMTVQILTVQIKTGNRVADHRVTPLTPRHAFPPTASRQLPAASNRLADLPAHHAVYSSQTGINYNSAPNVRSTGAQQLRVVPLPKVAAQQASASSSITNKQASRQSGFHVPIFVFRQ